MNLNELQNLMDDLARNKGPSDSELESREEELRAEFEAHPEWAEQMRKRDEFDLKLCEVMPQVEIPEGLKERLLSAVDEPQAPAKAAPAAGQRPQSRRKAIGLFASATALAAFALWMALPPLQPELEVGVIEQELPKLWDAAESGFPDARPAQAILPSGGWHSNQLRFHHGWKTREVSGESLAFRKFEFLSDRGLLHTGLLASLPLSSLTDPPRLTDPFSDAPTYKPIGDGSILAIVTWKDPQTERVYFLAVPAEDHTLKALKELLNIPLA